MFSLESCGGCDVMEKGWMTTHSTGGFTHALVGTRGSTMFCPESCCCSSHLSWYWCGLCSLTPHPRWDVLWGRHKGAASLSVRASFPPRAGLRGRPRLPNVRFHPAAEGSVWLSGLAACRQMNKINKNIDKLPLLNGYTPSIKFHSFICCPLLPQRNGSIHPPPPPPPPLCGCTSAVPPRGHCLLCLSDINKKQLMCFIPALSHSSECVSPSELLFGFTLSLSLCV